MIIFLSVFILFIIFLAAGFIKYLYKGSSVSESVDISIITAAKNEAAVIERFVSSVKNLDYPKEKFELILVDDNSSDNTYEIACRSMENQENLRSINAGIKTIGAKRGALFKGIQLSRFPYIVVTDADCVPSVEWLKICAGEFEKGNDFIFGPAPFFKEEGLVNKISIMENIKNQFMSFSLASLGMPYSASARNMGFSKKTFFQIGGYENTLDSLSGDDDLLLREALKNKIKVSAFYNKNAMVYSSTKKSLKDYIKQKTRHTKSSLYYSIKNKIVLSGWHLLNLFMLLSLLLIFVNINFVWLFIVKIIADILIITVTQQYFTYKFNLAQIFYLDILYELFIIINFFNSIFRKIEWK